MEVTPTLEYINTAWKTATRVVLGDEIGDIWKYKEYLERYAHLPMEKNGVYFPSKRYENITKTADYHNVSSVISKLRKPFTDINEIKDIDNLFELAKDHFTYIGNVVLGNSNYVEKSANIINSSYVYKSNTVIKSKYVAYTSYAKDVEYVFGSHALGSMKFIIATNISGGGDPIARIFESFYMLGGTYDAYFSHNLWGCSEAFFSFFQKGKRYIIGNNELPKDKYLKVKESLLEQIRADLERKKPKTLYEIIRSSDTKYNINEIELDEEPPEKVRRSFMSTSHVILGKKLNIENKKVINFLTRANPYYHIDKIMAGGYKDTVGGIGYYLGKIGKDLLKHYIPIQKVGEISEERIDLGSNVTITLEDLIEKFKESRLPAINISLNGHNIENVEGAPCFHSSHIYRVIDGIKAKTSAYSLWPRESTDTFGSFSVFESHFVIRSYGSENLNRAFEVDASNKVSDAYYLHMCEGVSNAAFSFGLRGSNEKYYVLNTQIDKTTYEKMKENLQDWIVSRIDKGKKVPHISELNAL